MPHKWLTGPSKVPGALEKSDALAEAVNYTLS
jgi:hypothetical protein